VELPPHFELDVWQLPPRGLIGVCYSRCAEVQGTAGLVTQRSQVRVIKKEVPSVGERLILEWTCERCAGTLTM